VCAAFQGGRKGPDGIDSGLPYLFDFPFARAVRSGLGVKNDLRLIPKVLRQDGLYPNPDGLVTFLGNHDDFSRLATALDERMELMKLAYAILLGTRGTPLLYGGDETAGMLGARDPFNRRDFPGGFPGDSRSVFVREQRTQREKELIGFVSEWVRARRGSKALTAGTLITLAASKDHWLFLRQVPGERALVAVSLSAKSKTISLELPAELTGVSALSSLVGGTQEARVTKIRLEYTLPAYGTAAWRVEGPRAP
jgi:glycosidase